MKDEHKKKRIIWDFIGRCIINTVAISGLALLFQAGVSFITWELLFRVDLSFLRIATAAGVFLAVVATYNDHN